MLKLLVILMFCCSCVTSSAVVPRGRDFWRTLKAADFAVPEGYSVDEVFADSESLVDLVDPELRDEVGYGLSVAWVIKQQRVSTAELRNHVRRLCQRMVAFHERSPNAVLGRSFSALRLSLVAAADARTPVLDDALRQQLLSAALSALANEDDLRGHGPTLGWVHATAHVADVLKFLAKNPLLNGAQQRLIAEGVTQRLARGDPFIWGEDERLAQVLRWLALRPDADLTAVHAWLDSLSPRWKELWATPTLDERRYAALNNTKLTLRSVLFYLETEEQPAEAVTTLKRKLISTIAELL